MNMKRILIITLIAVAILASVSVVSAGLFDGLFGEEHQDNVIEIDNIKFNTTNITKFVLYNETEESGAHGSWYMDENDTGYNVHIFNLSGVDRSTFDEFVSYYEDEYDNRPSQTINGAVIYTDSADTGDKVGEPRYIAYVKNNDLQTIVDFASPDANETAKMVLSLKFID